MPVYTSVWVNCPDCNSAVEFPTPVGPEAAEYDLNDAPPEVLRDIQDDWWLCPNCGTTVGVELEARLVGKAIKHLWH